MKAPVEAKSKKMMDTACTSPALTTLTTSGKSGEFLSISSNDVSNKYQET